MKLYLTKDEVGNLFSAPLKLMTESDLAQTLKKCDLIRIGGITYYSISAELFTELVDRLECYSDVVEYFRVKGEIRGFVAGALSVLILLGSVIFVSMRLL